jgi:hypothetical protein
MRQSFANIHAEYTENRWSPGRMSMMKNTTRSAAQPI